MQKPCRGAKICSKSPTPEIIGLYFRKIYRLLIHHCASTLAQSSVSTFKKILAQITGIFKLNSESTGRHTLVCIYIKSLTVCGVIVPFDWFYYILYSGLSWKFVASCLLILETLETSIFLISNAPPLGKGLHSHPPGRA